MEKRSVKDAPTIIDTNVSMLTSDTQLTSSMELGEYFLHIHIIQTAKVFSEEGDLDAIIRVKAFGETKWSKLIKGVAANSTTFWDDHMFFFKNFVTRSELEESSYEIAVCDHKLRTRLKNKDGFMQSNVVGSTAGSLIDIYNSNEHAIVDRQTVLINPKRDVTQQYGFIHYSINFVRAGQPRKNLDMRTVGKFTKDLLLIPPQIKMQYRQLIICIYRGRHFVSDDIMSKADPFILCEMGGSEIRTEVRMNEDAPVFNTKMLIPLTIPLVDETLRVKLYDKELIDG